MTDINWKFEAQKQAACAGELRISLAERLESLRTQAAEIGQHLILEDNDLDRVILEWKLKQLREQIDWLEGILYGQ